MKYKKGDRVIVWHNGYKRFHEGVVTGELYDPSNPEAYIVYKGPNYTKTHETTYWSHVKDVKLVSKLARVLA